MSQENVDLVRRGYEAWNANDLDWFLGHIAPDYEFRPAIRGFFDLEEVYRGVEGWRSFWARWRDAWESIGVRVGRTEDLGTRVLVLVTFEGKGRESGVEVSLQVVHLLSLRDGLFVRLDVFRSWDEALEAAGRRE